MGPGNALDFGLTLSAIRDTEMNIEIKKLIAGNELAKQFEAVKALNFPLPSRRYTCEVCGGRNRRNKQDRFLPHICRSCE